MSSEIIGLRLQAMACLRRYKLFAGLAGKGYEHLGLNVQALLERLNFIWYASQLKVRYYVS